MMRLFVFTLVSCLVNAEVHFSENFPTTDSINEWTKSEHHPEDKRGTWSISSNAAWDEKEYGLKTETDNRFYGISKKLESPFSNKGAKFVLQYLVKFEKSVTCGGSYVKLLASDFDATKFNGDTPYLLMFGPDLCGYSTKKVHAIFNYNGKNHLIKKDVTCKDDLLSHLYTFILTPDNKYQILIDNKQVSDGTLEGDWDMLPPTQIDDPKAVKPEDWVDEVEIVDENDKKPDDWEQSKTIPDPNSKKPEDWDDEMDGDWERPQIDNPEYKGEWEPKKITNPAYKGPWNAPRIDNPDFKSNDELYLMNDIAAVGFDLWKVDSGSIFDNILITDDPDFAKQQGEELWRPRYDAELAKKKKDEEAEASKPVEPEEKDTNDEETGETPVLNEEEETEEPESESHEEL